MYRNHMTLRLNSVSSGRWMSNTYRLTATQVNYLTSSTSILSLMRPAENVFIFPFKEQSSHSTIQFLKMAIKHFGYKPKIIQTDNCFEFTHFKETKQVHPLDLLCQELGIEHKLIRPRTPRHNGKVERSHRNDNRRFYQHLTFFSYDDLIKQMKTYLLSLQTTPYANFRMEISYR